MSQNKKLIFLGIDGMDPGLTEKYLSEGLLPNFAALSATGSYGRLNTINPPQSPVVWASIATGVNPGEHGVFDFLHRNPETYTPYLSILQLEKHRYVSPLKAPTFWEKLTQQRIHSQVLRWPVSFPPREIKGSLLAGLGVPDIKGTLGLYSFITTDKGFDKSGTKGHINVVNIEGNLISTHIRGPFTASLSGRKETSTPFIIKLSTNSVQCHVDNLIVELQEGTWSEWTAIKFNIGFMKKATALCRFYLKSISPEFSLYITPLHVSCDSDVFPVTFPLSYGKELENGIGVYGTLGLPEDTNALNDGVLNEDEFLSLCHTVMEEREKMFFYELDRFNEGVLACVFDTGDRIQHMFWRYLDTAHPLYDQKSANKYEGVILDYYRRMDRLVGEALQRIDESTALIVASDHGFSTFRRDVHINTWLVQEGYLVLKNGAREGGELFKDVDWGSTQAYALGLNSLYINLRGREGKGFVTPSAKEDLKREIAGKLKAMTDNGRVVIRDVHDTSEIYSGKAVGAAPDLIIGYERGYRGSWQNAVGQAPAGDAIVDNYRKWSGDHCCDGSIVPGVIFTKGLSVNDIKSIYCIAPKIIDYFDRNW